MVTSRAGNGRHQRADGHLRHRQQHSQARAARIRRDGFQRVVEIGAPCVPCRSQPGQQRCRRADCQSKREYAPVERGIERITLVGSNGPTSRTTGSAPLTTGRQTWASNNPARPPAAANRALSASQCRTSRARVAPSAARTAISRSRPAARASSSPATLAQASKSRSAYRPSGAAARAKARAQRRGRRARSIPSQ